MNQFIPNTLVNIPLATELSVLYEISSLPFTDTEEDFIQQTTYKATRIFPLRRFAIISVKQDEFRLLGAFGLNPSEDIRAAMADGLPNRFKFTFSLSGEQITIFMEKSSEISMKEQRLFTLLSKRFQEGFTAIRSVTERIRVEKELLQREKDLYSILENNPAGIVLIDADTREITWANSNALKKIRGTKNEVLGQPCHRFFCKQQKGQCPVLDQGATFDKSEQILTTADQEDVPILKSISHVKYRGKSHLLEAFFDLSRYKQMQTQLRQAQKMQAIGTLAGGIAHDFNNILAAVIGYAELAMVGAPKDTHVRKSIEEVIKAGNRAAELVKQILNFTRQSEATRSPLLMTPIIKESLKLLRATLPSSIEIRAELKENTGIVEAEAIQIQQVLMNLCTNAAYAMKEKGGILRVGLERSHPSAKAMSDFPELQPGDYLKLTVTDTGHGMPPSLVERIFDPYFTTKQGGDGSGMGLTIVHTIVRNHQGAIVVESEPETGTTFSVFLPAIETRTNSHTENSTDIQLPKGNERILFVDDEASIVEIGKEALSLLGYQVVAKNDSHSALELFESHPEDFDLVITDLTMPGMTGDRMAKCILDISPNTPIILCTGFGHHITPEKAMELGFRAVARKPLMMSDLAMIIRQVLEGGIN